MIAEPPFPLHYIRQGPATLAFSLHASAAGPAAPLLLLLPGFGHQWAQYAALVQHHQAQGMQVALLHLFHHGGSRWALRGQAVQPAQWVALVQQLLAQVGHSQFHLLAFSLGARPALSLYAAMPSQVCSLQLLAPQGLVPQAWYALATGTAAGRGLFRLMLGRPRLLLASMQALHRLGLLPASLLRFATSQMNSRRKRWQVYRTWLAYRHLGLPSQALAQLLAQHHTPCQLWLAQGDDLLPPSRLRPLRRRLHTLPLHLLPGGHSALPRMVAQHLQRSSTVAAVA